MPTNYARVYRCRFCKELFQDGSALRSELFYYLQGDYAMTEHHCEKGGVIAIADLVAIEEAPRGS